MQGYKEFVTNRIGPAMTRRMGDSWQQKDGVHGHICHTLRDNFIDGSVPTFCALKGELFRNVKIHYHRWSKCLTSSQVMCISFFRKFFEQPEYEPVLLELLRQGGLCIPADAEIANAILEYEPDSAEGTNFDFYLRLTDGRHVSFEIKYTEVEFGSVSQTAADPKKYIRKWESVYSRMSALCPYFQGPDAMNMQEFYRNYQINRNIAWAGTPQDIAVFLTPENNAALDGGRRYIDHFENPNIVNLYWERLLPRLMGLIGGELARYYSAFWQKYFAFLQECT